MAAHASEDDHHHDFDALVEGESARVEIPLEVRVQTARDSREEGSDAEGRDLVAGCVQAHGLGRHFIIGHRQKSAPMGGIEQRPHRVHGQRR